MEQEVACENLNIAELDQIEITPKEYENILNI